MAISANGVYRKISESTYRIEIDNVVYYFASRNHLEKFKEKLEIKREFINKSLEKRFGIKGVYDVIADLVLYTNVETYGFYITINGRSCDCLENLQLDGLKVISKS